MSNVAIISELKQRLPEDSWPWLIPALHQDPLVWEALQHPDFRGLVLSKLSPQPEHWSPANLAVLAVHPDLDLETLRSSHPGELEPELIDRVGSLDPATAIPATLAEAGLLALALSNNPQPFQEWFPQLHHETNPAYRKGRFSTLSCLFGLLKNPASMLRELQPQTVIEILLRQPWPSSRLKEQFLHLLLRQPAERQIALLNALEYQRPMIATELASKLLTSPESPEKSASLDAFQEILSKLSHQYAKAVQQRVAAKTEQRHKTLQDIWLHAQELLVASGLQMAQDSSAQENPEAVLSIWQATNQFWSPQATAELAVDLFEQGHDNQALQLIDVLNQEPADHPAILLAQSHAHARQSNLKQARYLSEQALNTCLGMANGSFELQIQLSNLLCALGQPKLAQEAIQSVMVSQPNDLRILLSASQNAIILGQTQTACQYADLAVMLLPHDLEGHRARCLAYTQAAKNNILPWQEAISAQQALIDLLPAHDVQARLELVRLALQAGQPALAHETCEQILLAEPQNGVALALQGTILDTQNQPEKAQTCFERAVQASPEQGEVWLLLAQSQHKTGQAEAALESLQQGCNAATGDAKLLFTLGQAYRQMQQYSAAREVLKKADELVKEKTYQRDFQLQAQIAVQLAETLWALGHTEQATAIAAQAHSSAPADLELGRTYARLLVASGQTAGVLPLLEWLSIQLPQDMELQLAFARALLATPGNASQAAVILEKLIQREPPEPEALALYAEALAAEQQWLTAIEAYQVALRTRLPQQNDWQRRLALGLAQVALQAQQPETSVAALEPLHARHPKDLAVLQLLACAYAAAGLDEQAVQAAAAAYQLEPGELDNLAWYADFHIQQGDPGQAVQALENAISLDPENIPLHMRLAQVQEKLGRKREARKHYATVCKIETAGLEELVGAAQALLALQAPQDAITGLERARYSCPQDGQLELLVEVLDALAQAYYRTGALPAALEALNQALEIAPARADLFSAKASLHFENGELQAASQSIRAALELAPHEAAYLRQAARLLRHQGLPEQAFQYAVQSYTSAPNHLGSRALAAELALALLKEQRASEYLQIPPGTQIDSSREDTLAFYCLRAEHSLVADEEIAAAEALTSAMKIQAAHPRVLALQALLAARQNGHEHGQKTFLQALEKLGKVGQKPGLPETYLALAQTALVYHNWSTALYLLGEAVALAPQEARCQLAFARGLVLRAEQQRFCDAAKAERHAPGKSALADYACQQFEQALLQAAEQVGSRQDQTDIPLWLARGQATFRPSPEHAALLGARRHTTANLSAILAALRNAGEEEQAADLALEMLASPSQDARLLAECSLSLEQDHKEQALQAAQAALKLSIRQSLPDRPLYYALLADLCEQTGDYVQARQAIEAALAIWDDEPVWHIRLAEGLLSAPSEDLADPRAAIMHLNQVLENDPRNLKLHLQLGKAYLLAKDPTAAIRAFKHAVRHHPQHAQLWFAMAQAHQAAGESDPARACAKQALEVDPDHMDAALLLSELALDADDLEGSLAYSQEILAKQPSNSQALLLQARALERLNRPTEALAAFEHALPGNAKTVPLLLEHANLVHKVRGDTAGLKTLEHLASRHPQEPRILAALADALLAANQPENAILAAQKAINHPVNDLPVEQSSHLRVLLGRLLRQAGQLDQAIHHLHAALETNPDAIEAAIELGRVYQDRREYVQAMQVLQDAIQRAPTDARPLYQAGLALKEAHDYPGAESFLRRAAKLAPQDVNIHRQLAAMVALNLVHNPKAVVAQELHV